MIIKNTTTNNNKRKNSFFMKLTLLLIAWFPSEADPEMKTGVAVVFWKVVPGNIRKGVRP